MSDTKSYLQILSLNTYYGQLANELSIFVEEKMRDVSVFCFQETDDKTRDILDDILLENFARHHTSKLSYEGTQYVTTYIRRDIDILEVTPIHADVQGTGLALRCRLVDSWGSRITVSNVYGISQPGHKLDTPERLALTRDLIDLAHNSGDIEVMAGDFNLAPETESVRMFAANGFRNLIEEFEIPTTRNEIAWQKFPAHMKQLYADFAFVRGEDVSYSFRVEDVTVSDHLPLEVGIQQAMSNHQTRRHQSELQHAQAR